MITLVDYLGDVPYSQAALGVENLNPGLDSGASIYDAALALILEAKQHFSVPAQSPSNDLFYGEAELTGAKLQVLWIKT